GCWVPRHDRWVLVVEKLDGETVDVVERRLPSELPGHVLITSRHPLPGSRHNLEPLPLDAATELLLRRAPNGDAAVARTLAANLDRLPLALEQASAYLEQTEEQLATYAELLQTNLVGLLADGRSRTTQARWSRLGPFPSGASRSDHRPRPTCCASAPS